MRQFTEAIIELAIVFAQRQRTWNNAFDINSILRTGFCDENQIKLKKRTHLGHERLEVLSRLSCDGPPFRVINKHCDMDFELIIKNGNKRRL